MSSLSFVLGDARARLVALPGVTLFPHALPADPAVAAFIICGVRCYAVRTEGDAFSASFHIGMGEHLPLAEAATEDVAFAAVVEHIRRIGHLPAWWSAKTDAAERTAAADILVRFAAPLSLATWGRLPAC